MPATGTVAVMARLLRGELRRRDMTQRDFARLVKVSEKHLSEVLNGVEMARAVTLDAWARALGCEFGVTLMRRDDSR